MIIDKLNDLILNFYIKAHSWFPKDCCNLGEDCKPVPCDQLLETAEGWKFAGKLFTRVLPSQDAFCYACIGQYTGTPFCLFIQMSS